MPSAVGYSGTPLSKKLGIKPSNRVFIFGAPDGFTELLEPMPERVVFQHRAGPDTDLAHVFVTRREELSKQLSTLRRKLNPQATLWVSWPKKASKLPTSITEDTVRELALPLGLVDVKVCAVTEVWSGLKLVVRKELRASNAP
ncbi:MAG: DUF3052 domain-containing protein [Burkholderiaceae bacterium]